MKLNENDMWALQLFVDFANMDLKNLKPGDKAKLRTVKGLSFSPTSDKSAYPGNITWPNEPIQVVELQESVRQLFRALLMPLTHVTEYGVIARKQPAGAKWLMGADTFYWQFVTTPNATYHLTIMPIAKNREEFVRIQIMKMLEGFPDHAIRKCQDCGRYFLNPTRRKKGFCSPQCMWRLNTEKWRDAHRDDYRKNQAILMKDRRKGKFGPRSKYTKARRMKKS